jgi:catechol 2,3-dioxygenase-like lactoylglutathione lyase family enzyme
MIIDHISLTASDYEKSKRFFFAALTPLGIEQVTAFYAAAMGAGGKDNGPPGIRASYHPNYFGAFVIGPDGHNVEAVCHKPEP